MPKSSEHPVDETTNAVTAAVDDLFGPRAPDAVVVVPVDSGHEEELWRVRPVPVVTG